MDSDIFVADITDAKSRLSRAKKVATGLAPQLSPDGRYLAYLQRGQNPSSQPQLAIVNVETSRPERVSSAIQLPSGSNFPVDWTEQNLAWASPEDLYFVERADRAEVSRLVHYRVGAGARPLSATETASRLTDIFPSSDGQTIAYLTSKSTGELGQETYQLHVVDVVSGEHRVVRELGPQYLVRVRGWLRDDAGLVLARSVDFQDQTWTLELLVVSTNRGTIQYKATIDHVVNASRLVPRYSDLYFTRSVDGIGNLFAYSFASRKTRQVSENSVLDVTFGSVAQLGAEYVVGIRHERTRDIHLLDARPRAGRSLRIP